MSARRPRPALWGLALLGLSLLTALWPGAAWAETRIAVVDTQRCVMQTEDGLRAQATLKKFFDSRQRELDNRQNSLQKEREQLAKQSRILSKAAFQRRMEHWQRRMVEVQTLFVEYNKELEKKQAELTQPILRKMFRVIRRVAQSRGYDLVIDRSAVPFSRKDLDLTELVVQMYNSGALPDDEPSAADEKEEPGKPAGE